MNDFCFKLIAYRLWFIFIGTKGINFIIKKTSNKHNRLCPQTQEMCWDVICFQYQLMMSFCLHSISQYQRASVIYYSDGWLIMDRTSLVTQLFKIQMNPAHIVKCGRLHVALVLWGTFTSKMRNNAATIEDISANKNGGEKKDVADRIHFLFKRHWASHATCAFTAFFTLCFWSLQSPNR